MTELEISIGGRVFSVACDNEEQEKVKEAAALINEEADSIQSQLGRLPESKNVITFCINDSRSIGRCRD